MTASTPYPLLLMSLTRHLARSFYVVGACGAGLASFVSTFGIIAAIGATPGLCPESLSDRRCREVVSDGANFAAYGLVVAGAFSVLAVGGRLALDSDPWA